MGKILRRLFSPTSELYRIFLKEDEKPLFYVDDKIKKKLEEVVRTRLISSSTRDQVHDLTNSEF